MDVYNIEDNFESCEKIENLNNEIEKILNDIYIYHIEDNKHNTSLNIYKYERHISSISDNLDKYSNLILLRAFEEKINQLITVIYIFFINIKSYSKNIFIKNFYLN